MGNHRRARETVVLADPVSWSINNAAVNQPGSTSQINISNKGVLDLRKSYLEFIVDGLGDNRLFYPNVFEVVSFSMGSNLQVQLPFNGPMSDALYLRSAREEISKAGIFADHAFFHPLVIADFYTQDSIRAGKGKKYRLPMSALCEAFAELETVFVGLGQPLQIQLRLRPAGQVTNGAAAAYTVTQGRLILSYVELD